MAKMNSSFEMVVSEKENGKYVPRGKVAVFYPTLADLNVLNATIKETSEDGFPVYADDLHAYTFDAVLAAVKANARNKLEVVNGTVRLKDGLQIAETTEQLLESGGGNNGAALQAIRDFLAAAKAYLATTGKSSGVQAAVLAFFTKPDTLALVDDISKREKVRQYLADFVSTITTEQATAWQRRIEAIDAQCDAVSALDSADF